MEELFIGIDIGGTKNAVCIADIELNIYEKVLLKSGKDIEPMEILEDIISICKKFIEKYQINNKYIKAIGISCGGPLDSKKGIILSPPNLPLWNKIEITHILKSRLGVETYIQNDANACALAEWKFGSAKGYNNVVFLTFGTGLGAGLILDGKLYSGTNDMAGEVGHIRLSENGPIGYNKQGSFEGYCSGAGIKRLAEIVIKDEWNKKNYDCFCKNESELDNLTAKDIFLHARRGDRIAQKIVDMCAENLGKGLAILIDILNPECIVLGSIYSRNEKMLRNKALNMIKKEALSRASKVCDIKTAGLNENVGDIASLTVAILNSNI